MCTGVQTAQSKKKYAINYRPDSTLHDPPTQTVKSDSTQENCVDLIVRNHENFLNFNQKLSEKQSENVKTKLRRFLCFQWSKFQARECLFEKNELGLYEEDENSEKKKGDIDKYLAVGQEAAYVR